MTLGYVTLWCGMCSAEGNRDTRFYKPSHQIGHNRSLSDWAAWPDALDLPRLRPGNGHGRRPVCVPTVTTLMICSASYVRATGRPH